MWGFRLNLKHKSVRDFKVFFSRVTCVRRAELPPNLPLYPASANGRPPSLGICAQRHTSCNIRCAFCNSFSGDGLKSGTLFDFNAREGNPPSHSS
jgi:hypothetical protein